MMGGIMTELELVDTKELIEELISRGDGCLVAMVMPIDGDPDNNRVFCRRSGNFMAQLGLAHFAVKEIESVMVFNEYDSPEEVDGCGNGSDGSEL